ncbi:tumor necrosis factor receptor superfamily member 8 isoform X1 [Panthera pardus]|uniref:Tumor necrosis factor receptor superfamily member 8 isoform X1 n=1 Tax=Panthera pardus TaxID=9691 RepID=A0A9W2V8K8_PANPR|nr:tumor necrosis factor receptor superfamily member 8 isoform X1 [Panthera pardus]
MRPLGAVLGLLLLGVLGAFPQDRVPRDVYAGDPGHHHDKTAGLPCPQGSPDCRKQCEPDYYLNRDGRCTACVSCARDDLVEKMPCSGNSSRVCECRAGTFCATSATNSCARCIPHTVCPKGMIVKVQGTAQMDTVCERPSPVTSPDLGAGPEDCQAPTSDTSAQAGPLVTSVSSSARTTLLGGGTAITPEDDSKMTGAPGSPSSVRKPSPDPGLTPQPPCPQGSPDCRKQCEPDYYLDRDGRCTACVSCARDDLVEKMPCSGNSSRVCECRAGTFCATSATNSCARCIPHTVCPKGMIVKVQGTAQMDTVCERPSPVTSPDLGTGPEDCQAPTSDTSAQAGPLVTSVSSSARTTLLRGGTAITPEDDSKMTGAPGSPSSVRKPSPDPGLTPQPPCPQGSPDCRKQCEPDYYLDRDGRCTACVSCARDDLVEKTPCTWNSSRVCECRPGMFCVTPVTNSCAHCVTRPVCPPGMATKPQGTAERDATHEPPPPLEAHPECSTNPEDSKAPTSATASPVSAADPQGSKEHGGGNTHTWGDTFTSTSSPISFSSTGKPILVSGPVLFWMVMILVVVLVSISFLLCHWRACRKWIRQKLHLCYPAQTFRPTLEPVDSRPRRNLTQLRSCISVAEPGTEELGLMGPPVMETCPNGEVCLESMRLLDASPAGSPPSPRDLPEPRVTSEHTNNRIEKIYIMKADTVIVGTVRTEVPEGRGLAGPTGPELEEDLEGDHAYPHFPEQETEPPLGSCGDVMFSVEEEGKEAPLPMTVSEK